MDFISFRADKELKKKLEELAELENKNKSEEYREIFLLGMGEKRKEIAIRKYRNKELSLGKAAELAGITIWEFIQFLKEKQVPMNIAKEEVIKGVEGL